VNDFSPLGGTSDLLADDLLLDRIAGRADAGAEPVSVLLAALAAHADTPLPARTGRRRIANKHRYLGAFAALAVAASGAGVAAAVTLPDGGSLLADRARIEQRMEQSARSGAPSALLSRLGLPSTDGTTASRGLVLARGANGTFVLLPAAVAAAQAPAARAAVGGAGDDTGGAGDHADGAAGRLATRGADGTPSAVAPEGAAGAAGAAKAKGPKDKSTNPAHTRTAGGAKPAKGNSQDPNAPSADAQGANGQAAANGQGAEAPAGGDSIWVLDPATTGATAAYPVAAEPGLTASAPRLVGPNTQQTLVGPPATPPVAGGRNAAAPVKTPPPGSNKPAIPPGQGGARPTRPSALSGATTPGNTAGSDPGTAAGSAPEATQPSPAPAP
jgi:hypothetical protein